ncbi:MAG: hypothetical protein IT336_04015, partial [Thermomicrobiales bacterium]|nr:hypothetical protein [Thermomicrobiales bacterium]
VNELPASFPEVRAVVWFNQNKEADWALDSSDTALAAFRNAIDRAYYRGAFWRKG